MQIETTVLELSAAKPFVPSFTRWFFAPPAPAATAAPASQPAMGDPRPLRVCVTAARFPRCERCESTGERERVERSRQPVRGSLRRPPRTSPTLSAKLYGSSVNVVVNVLASNSATILSLLWITYTVCVSECVRVCEETITHWNNMIKHTCANTRNHCTV
ncbi:uncharacterized protein LOC118511032 isoform X2 [Anopheles stephensi]|uniref:uncharacterized protein LOC118511032 isoform X2 n=1 Tax=Anopheles stephensi TaxID=30069 RepID=UPI001658BE55|nr:uncharacterized protein LOC118511032 isoform X2 [Anopheles stephensi]